MPYQLTEPHPTTTANSYIHTGRGGAGNMYKASKTTSSSKPASVVPNKKGKFSSGRGGAGNILPLSEAMPFSFDEELSLQTTREQHHDVWHVGRGGAGNWSRKDSNASMRGSDELERKKSTDTVGSNASSTRSGFLGRLSSAFERR
jgi:hypothetical protein